MLMTIGLTIIFNTLQLLLFTISTTMAFYTAALLEERKLKEIFEEEYLEYTMRTPQFIVGV